MGCINIRPRLHWCTESCQEGIQGKSFQPSLLPRQIVKTQQQIFAISKSICTPIQSNRAKTSQTIRIEYR